MSGEVMLGPYLNRDAAFEIARPPQSREYSKAREAAWYWCCLCS